MDFSSGNAIPRSPMVSMSPEMKVAVRKAGIDLGGYRSTSQMRNSSSGSRSSTPLYNQRPISISNQGGVQIHRQRSSTPLSLANSRNPSPALNNRGTNSALKSRGESPMPMVMNQRSLNHSNHSNHSNHRNPSPAGSFLGAEESRDGLTSFDFSNQDQMEEMDEVLVQRYLNEKKKRKMFEKNCMNLTNEIHVVQRTMENKIDDIDKERMTAEMKFEEQEKMTMSLHSAVQNLQSQFSRQTEENESKVITIREDADKQIVQLRGDAAEKITDLNNELNESRAEYSTSQNMFEMESQKLFTLETEFKSLDSKYEARGIELEAERTKAEDLNLMLNDHQVIGEINEGRTNALSTELVQMKERLDFEGGKAQDFSGELKLLSCQYVESIEQVSNLKTTVKSLSEKLETKEEELKSELVNSAYTSNQLEEMATGFIESDETLQKEKASTELLTKTISSLKEELETEKFKRHELQDGIALVETSRSEKNTEVDKLHISCDSLAVELFEMSERCKSEVEKSANLSHDIEIAQTARDDYQGKLVNEEERAAMMSLELIEAREEVITYAKNLSFIKTELEESRSSHDMLNNDLKLMEEDFQDIDNALQQTIEENEKTLEYEQKKSTSLKIELDALKDIHKTKMEVLAQAEKNQKETKEKYDTMAFTLNTQTKEYHNTKTTLEKEKNEFEVKLSDEHNKMTNVSVDADNMKNQYMSLFDNLVETEETLEKSREKVESMKNIIEEKDKEIREVKWRFGQKIELKDESRRQEQENEVSNAEKLEEVQQKSKGLYNKLVEAEERILDKEDETLKNTKLMKEKESECQLLKDMLKKEKKGVPQRKLRVAKKMIHAEKERQKLLVGEIEAKDVIFQRTTEQMNNLQVDLDKTQVLLQLERQKKATHSSRALKELHEQLAVEISKAKIDKEDSEAAIIHEQSKANSYAIRLKQLAESPDTEALSKALGETHDLNQSLFALTQHNKVLQRASDENSEEKKNLMTRITEMENKFIAVTHSMDTLTLYCSELEGEKKKLKQEAIGQKNLHPLLSSLNLADDLLTIGPITFSDDEESRGDNSILSWNESVTAPLALVKEQDEYQDGDQTTGTNQTGFEISFK